MLKLLAGPFFPFVFKSNFASAMFELPRGKGKGTVSALHLRLMSLSNKSCVGLDVYKRLKQRKFHL